MNDPATTPPTVCPDCGEDWDDCECPAPCMKLLVIAILALGVVVFVWMLGSM